MWGPEQALEHCFVPGYDADIAFLLDARMDTAPRRELVIYSPGLLYKKRNLLLYNPALWQE